MRTGLLIFLPLLLLAGCLRLEREYPEKNFFSLEARRSGEVVASPLGEALRLERFRVSPRFQGRPFVYRSGELQYEEDFYNRFFAPPGELLREETARWLRAAGLFSQLYTEPAPVVPEYFLEGSVTALYGDFRRSPARAVLEAGFTLFHEEEARPRVVLRRDYRREIPLPAPTPEALAAGWSEALAQILAELERDLRQSMNPAPGGAPQ